MAYQKDETDLVHSSVTKYCLLDKVIYVDYLDSKVHDCIYQTVDRFDIIYCQYDWIGTVFAKIKCESRFKGKLVVCVRGGSLGRRVRKNVQGYKLLFKYTDLFLPVCYYFAQNLIDFGVKKEKIIVHHSAIDCKAIPYKQRDYSHRSIRILSIARIVNSKGLEFESVFIVGLEEDLFPHVNSKNTIEEIEEERRLFYVGMTRAKKYLHLLNAQYRYLFGGIKLSTPSRFLKEIPKEYIENLSSKNSYEIEEDIVINTSANFSVGMRVAHNTFGRGIVQKVYQGSLGETLDILFEENNSTKSLVTKYAKLKVIT